PDRGTGYNYYSGTAWNAAPAQRIETSRCGWPSINPWMGNGEIVFGHNSSASLLKNTRSTKGTGAWTQQSLAGPTGAVDISWPRVMTSGASHNSVHVICLTYSAYQGLNLALLYWRSLDGGVTWDKRNVILPGMTSTDCLGFAGDEYAWASPKGDTIAFAVAGQWVDGFVMKSVDNGTTWTKTVFYNNPFKLTPLTTIVPRFACLDGSVAVELDHAGKAHVAVGRMYSNGDGSGHFYYPGTDGLVYWNENMAVLDTNRLTNLDSLDAHGQLIGYVAENTAGDSIVGFPKYGVGLSSFPQISIDNNSNISVIWAGLTVGNPSPDNLNYRHIWVRGLSAGSSSWGYMIDLNSSFLSIFKEYTYPSMAKKITNNNLKFIYQTADVPGSAVKDATVAYHTNNIEYRNDATWVGLDNQHPLENSISQNFPNPAGASTYIRISLARSGEVKMKISDITGYTVMELNKGLINSGNHDIMINTSQLKSGIYFYTVSIGSEKITKKMIVQ
ncbi:MAG: T9SS type A sorting domain-containing protein, partial [Bacteroidota bacterium]